MASQLLTGGLVFTLADPLPMSLAELQTEIRDAMIASGEDSILTVRLIDGQSMLLNCAQAGYVILLQDYQHNPGRPLVSQPAGMPTVA
jgi:hypothetical protein